MQNNDIGNNVDAAIGKIMGSFERLEEARDLLVNERNPAVAGRLYYSIFSAITALHYLNNDEFVSHKKVLGEFNKLYIHTKIFPREYSRKIYDIQELRHESDYAIRPKITKEIIEEAFSFTNKFINEVKTYCSDKYSIPFDNLILNDKIENKKFIDAYIFFNKNDISHSDKSALGFMKEVVKIHGTNKETLKSAIEAIVDFKNESQEFGSKLLNDILKTDEYKKAFDKEQSKTSQYTKHIGYE